ncbi:unnamed protein product [Oppiella nova]|uniref:C-type lectin domain-containing protein n=1 Tax=Oppiella nova TaxID=334625 RepID=A0A7R9QNN1_9ACAR|nr:unnamed protein product [Oppiella nova]CAG2169298.1 unnamed protein product [Oppiella nova]
MTSHDEAVESCKFAKTGDNDPVPTLVSIDTLDEQEFLNKNIFNQPGIVDSIWIGAKRGNLSTFVWDDGTGIDYDNWAEHMPSNDNKEIADLQANTVPINFIYVQLGGQKRPQELWPMYKWAEITSNYHGRFFRAEYAGLSEPFGYAQGASTKRLVSVTQENCHYEQSDYESIELIPGKESIYLLTGQRIKKDNTGLQFKISDDEIKPDNEAIRIFQRIP